jgi:molybdate transport system substrate-binding protein
MSDRQATQQGRILPAMSRRMLMGLRAALAAALLAAPLAAAADELQVFAAGAVQSIAQETAADFERESGHRLHFVFGTAGALQNRIVAGEPADVAVLSQAAIAALAGRGLAAPAPQSVIGSIGSGIAIRRGAPLPRIATPEELRATLLAAGSISYGDPARGATSGMHFASVLERLGIAEQMRARTVLVPFGVEAIQRVAAGQSDLAVSQASEILANPDVTLAGPLPRALQNATTYTAAPLARAAAPEAATAYVRYLATQAAVVRFRARGFAEPE